MESSRDRGAPFRNMTQRPTELRMNLIDSRHALRARVQEFGLFIALRYTRISLGDLHEFITRIAKSLSCRASGPIRSNSVEPDRGDTAAGRAGLSSASAVWRDDAQQSCLSSREIAGCAGTSRVAF